MGKVFGKKDNGQVDVELEDFQSNGNGESQTTEMSPQETDKLEAVRDLLFGQNVKEYRDEFKELKDLIQENRAEIDKSAADFRSDVLEKLESLDEKINKKIDDTSQEIKDQLNSLSEAKADRKKIANLLSDMAKQLDS
ncbi:MAG: hypothetical protein AB8B73_08025 [Ekhidna sp.]